MLSLALAMSQTSNAQINFGLKAGINYNSNSIKESGTDVFSGSESKTGYHAGVWLRVKLPVLGWYIRPELVYTNLKNDVVFNNIKTTSYDFQKIDIPVLIGRKIFGVGNIFIGPSFQYVLDSDFNITDISKVDSKGFTVGLQVGAGLEFGKLGFDIRWERGFNGIESTLINSATGAAGVTSSLDFDTKINQIVFGLSYQL